MEFLRGTKELTVRTLTTAEMQVISAIANELGSADRAQLLADLENATARTATRDGSVIEFDIASYARPPFVGQQPFNVEGRVRDSDGAELELLLHTDHNGRLLELELVRYEKGDVIAPDWSTLRLLRTE